MKTIAFVIVALVCSGYILAQDVISPAGDYHQNSSVSVSYTIGEPISETFELEENILTQGFQQSKLIITAIKSPKILDFNLHIFPNPTRSSINIEIISENFTGASFYLMDINGKLVFEKETTNRLTEIDIKSLAPATYFLKVITENKDVLTYKIVKE